MPLLCSQWELHKNASHHIGIAEYRYFHKQSTAQIHHRFPENQSSCEKCPKCIVTNFWITKNMVSEGMFFSHETILRDANS
jgi:hypothetical protein